MNRKLKLMAVTIIAFSAITPLSRAENGKQQKLDARHLTEIRSSIVQLDRDLEQLQEVIIEELTEARDRKVFEQLNQVVDAVNSFRNSLKEGLPRSKIYTQYDALDAQLHALIASVRKVGKESKEIQRIANHLVATDDQLHYAISEGDISEARLHESIRRQCRAFAVTSLDLKRTAEYALGDVQGRDVLLKRLTKLVSATEQFQKNLDGKPDQTAMQVAFAPLNRAWEEVTESLKQLPSRDTISLLRSAFRADMLHERLFEMLQLQGKRPHLTIQT